MEQGAVLTAEVTLGPCWFLLVERIPPGEPRRIKDCATTLCCVFPHKRLQMLPKRMAFRAQALIRPCMRVPTTSSERQQAAAAAAPHAHCICHPAQNAGSLLEHTMQRLGTTTHAVQQSTQALTAVAAALLAQPQAQPPAAPARCCAHRRCTTSCVRHHRPPAAYVPPQPGAPPCLPAQQPGQTGSGTSSKPPAAAAAPRPAPPPPLRQQAPPVGQFTAPATPGDVHMNTRLSAQTLIP